MSKSIILLETPSSCGGCPAGHFEIHNTINFFRCFAHPDHKQSAVQYRYEKPDWCPLIELPPQATHENSDYGVSWNLGWNACLDSIEGD